MNVKLYGYEKCTTCRNAVQLLKAERVDFEWIAIRETPPSQKELRIVLERTGLPIRRLFNTSGREYSFLGLKDKLHRMTEGQQLDLLARNGNLVKRPVLIGDELALVGFNEELWRRELTPKSHEPSP